MHAAPCAAYIVMHARALSVLYARYFKLAAAFQSNMAEQVCGCLVMKKNTKSNVWQFFALMANEKGELIRTDPFADLVAKEYL